ncbi:MAG: hypothetical protein LBU85_07975, partial [Treponema sp.]|nr:hypothetical protein [Treponema sp.]
NQNIIKKKKKKKNPHTDNKLKKTYPPPPPPPVCRALLAGVLVLLLFSSCFTTSTIPQAPKVKVEFDNSLPPEKTTEIYTYYIGPISAFNGISVDWKAVQYKSTRIPAGDTTLEVTYWYYRKKQVVAFNCNLQPQKVYCFLYGRRGGLFGVEVYTFEKREKIPKEDDAKAFASHFTAFVPFLDALINQRIILE